MANAVAAVNATLTGEAKTATVALSAGTDTKGTVSTTDDVYVASQVIVANGAGAEGLNKKYMGTGYLLLTRFLPSGKSQLSGM